jgi:threonine dehydrogenase-like Zn-dependent dehydrogenase
LNVHTAGGRRLERAKAPHDALSVTREHAAKGEFDPSFMITHKFSLEDSAKGYELWRMKEDGCVRMVFTP